MIEKLQRGDVVVKIGGSNAYVVDDADRSSIWYGVKYLWSNKVFHSEIHKCSLDSDYVKVDFCKNPLNSDEVYAKLMPIARSFGKCGNE